MAPEQSGTLSDTEESIVAYLGSNPPEEGMLDKIAMGIGRSRATVLKYLGNLYAKGILDYRIIGRNKLWMVKQPPVPEERPSGTEPLRDTMVLASRAFAMHATLLRRADLEMLLDTPDTFIVTMLGDSTIVYRNRLAESLFSGARTFQELLRPEQAALLRKRLSDGNTGSPVSLDLDLASHTGVLRRFQVTFVLPGPGDPAGCIVALGEDLASRERSVRDLSSLLYIIRAAAMTRTEDDLLRVAMKGISDNLVSSLFAAVFLEDMRVAFATREIQEAELQRLRPLVDRCKLSLATQATGKDDPVYPVLEDLAGSKVPIGAVAVPIIEREEAIGVILLIPEAEVPATAFGNIEIIADEIASLLKMQRLDRERGEYVNTLLALNRLSGILNEVRDEETLLGQAIQAAIDSLGFEMGCVYLKGKDDEMILRAQKNMPGNLQKMCISGAFDTLFRQAFADKTVLYLTPEMPEYAMLDPAFRKNDIRTILIIPIRIGDSVEGLLNMGSKKIKEYLPVSLGNIASLGLQLGTALERSRLARALERQESRD